MPEVKEPQEVGELAEEFGDIVVPCPCQGGIFGAQEFNPLKEYLDLPILKALARVALEFCEERWRRELARGRVEIEREDSMDKVYEECFGEEPK